jgi:hypothetical protein
MPVPSSCTSSARTLAPAAPRDEKPTARTLPLTASNNSRPKASSRLTAAARSPGQSNSRALAAP